MRAAFKVKLASLAAILTLSLLAFVPAAQAAGSATYSLSASSTSLKSGDQVTLTINENSGSQTVNAVDVAISFDTTKLQFVSASGAGTSFVSFQATGSNSGANNTGTGHLVSYVSPPGNLTGSQKVGTIVLSVKDLSGSTTTPITFVDSSGIASATDSSDIWDHSLTGLTLNLAPKPATTTAPKTAPKKTTSSSKSTTTQPSTSQQQSSPTTPVPVNVTTNALTGYFVSVKVVDDKGKPVANVKVSLGDNIATSDSTGLAGFSNIAPGVYKVSVKSGNLLGTSTVDVDGTKPNSAVQQFEIKVKPKYNIALIGGIAGGVILLIVILLIIKGMGGKYKPIKHPGYEVPTAVVGGQSTPTQAPPAPTASASAPKPASSENLLKPTVIAPNGSGTPKA